MSLGVIGKVPNHSTFQGDIKIIPINGITTSTWNPRSGGLSKTTFKGTQEQITALAQDVKTNGWEYSIQGGHVWTLEVTFPYDIIVDQTEDQSNPLFTWELNNQPFEKDIMELGDRPFVGPLGVKTKNLIDQKLKTNNQTLEPWDPAEVSKAVDPLTAIVDANVLYALRRIGVRGKQGIIQTIKRTVIVPNKYDASALVNSNFNYKLFTKTQFLSVYNSNANALNRIPYVISNALPDTLPLSIYRNGKTQPVQPISGFSMDSQGIVTFVGYLQFPPEYHMVATNKVSITQHWVFNQWSAGPYGLYDASDNTTGANRGCDPGLIYAK